MSVLSQFLATGGKGNPLYSERPIITSQTWVTPVKGRYLVTAIGGGGSGAANGTAAGCGGAGGFAQSLWDLAAGFSLVLTCGAGGAEVTTTNTNGNAGGATTVSGSGLTTLTANGGAGGVQSYAGSAGGTASGGNVINVTGGSGFKGGGAVGVYGIGYSGNATDFAGAGVGGGPSTDGTNWPGTALFSGDEIKANPALYLESYVNPLYVLGGTILNGYKNGRLLSPNGGFAQQTSASGGVSQSGPGCGASNAVSGQTKSAAGLFSGGVSANSPLATVLLAGGAFGGGGGGLFYGVASTTGRGGCGGVIIEYMYTP